MTQLGTVPLLGVSGVSPNATDRAHTLLLFMLGLPSGCCYLSVDCLSAEL